MATKVCSMVVATGDDEEALLSVLAGTRGSMEEFLWIEGRSEERKLGSVI